MTIFVDDFYKVDASLQGKYRMSYMIGDDPAELDRFAKKLGMWEHWYKGTRPYGYYRASMENRHKAILLGATEVGYQTLSAMVALRYLGYDMEPVETACQRRNALSKEN